MLSTFGNPVMGVKCFSLQKFKANENYEVKLNTVLKYLSNHPINEFTFGFIELRERTKQKGPKNLVLYALAV